MENENETNNKVVQNLELYKDYLEKYENGDWTEKIQQLAENVKKIDNKNQTEKKKALDDNKKAMDNIVDALPPDFFLICKIVDGINKNKKMNILLFPQEADKSFRQGHTLYESDAPEITSKYNDQYIQKALKTYGELLNNEKPCAIIYVIHHKYLFLHCEVAVHYVDKKDHTQQTLAMRDGYFNNGCSFDETLYEKAINLSDDNKAENPHNDEASFSKKNNLTSFKENHQSDRTSCVINAIKFATSALKNIKKYNNLISPEDFNNQKESIQTFLNSIVPDDEKPKITSSSGIEWICERNGDEENHKNVLWLDTKYRNIEFDYDSKENKFKLKNAPEEFVSSGYRKYDQCNKKYLLSIGINESKLNQIYLKGKNGKEWNVGAFLKLRTLVQKYLGADFMNVRDNIVMALSGTRSTATNKTPPSLDYDDIKKKWQDNNKDKQFKQKKEIENQEDSEKYSNEENNIQNSEKGDSEKEDSEIDENKEEEESEETIKEAYIQEGNKKEDSQNNTNSKEKDNIFNNNNNDNNIQSYEDGNNNINNVNNVNVYENNQQEYTDEEYCQNIINTFVKNGTGLKELDVAKFRRSNKDKHLLQHKSAFFWLNEQERRNNALLDFINNDADESLDTLNNRLRNIRGGKCSWCCGDW